MEESKNLAYNSNIKASPDEVWSSNKQPVNEQDIPAVVTKADKPKIAKAHVLHRAMQQIQRFEHEDNYQVGDMVRVKMSSIFSNVRKLVKNNATKQIVVTYSPDVYRIERVIIPRRGLILILNIALRKLLFYQPALYYFGRMAGCIFRFAKLSQTG